MGLVALGDVERRDASADPRRRDVDLRPLDLARATRRRAASRHVLAKTKSNHPRGRENEQRHSATSVRRIRFSFQRSASQGACRGAKDRRARRSFAAFPRLQGVGWERGRGPVIPCVRRFERHASDLRTRQAPPSTMDRAPTRAMAFGSSNAPGRLLPVVDQHPRGEVERECLAQLLGDPAHGEERDGFTGECRGTPEPAVRPTASSRRRPGSASGVPTASRSGAVQVT